MICVERNYALSAHNTLRLQSIAEQCVRVTSFEKLREALVYGREQALSIYVIGGGSNVILPPRIPGLSIQMAIEGRSVVSASDGDVIVRVNAGEDWHTCVMWAHDHGYFGLENLALIPGSVGAAPIQNIGAYGVEIADRINRVQVMDIKTGILHWFTQPQCGFGYRDSRFKRDKQTAFIVCCVELHLSTVPCIENAYPALAARLPDRTVLPADVLQAVIALRRERLPDPSIEPNVGSFFKNPVIAVEKAADLLRQFPDMPQYPVSQSLMKLSAAWLIDYLGWRGRCEEGVKVSEKHALVLINVSAETSSGIVNVANKIAASVCDEFGVLLEREPVLFAQGEPA